MPEEKETVPAEENMNSANNIPATETVVTEAPAALDPAATDPAATDPVATDPTDTDPTDTDPIATDPTDTDPIATDPTDTDSIAIFDRNDKNWSRVSKKYAIVDLISNLIFAGILGAIAFFVFSVSKDDLNFIGMIAPAAISLAALINAFLAFRRVRAIGYVLRADDLVFRRGIMFERIVAVPYGRLQLVDINRGPLLRALGLATLKFVTASQSTGVNLPGLRIEEAEKLREELIRLAETRRSGL